MPYGLISDSHQHSWSAFSKTDENGVNSRNAIILDETIRAAQAVKDAGGDTLYHAGDLFHVRGSVAPSVLNPTLQAYRTIRDMGVQVRMIPGNHDMEAKDSGKMTNAIEALRGVGVDVIHGTCIFDDDRVIMTPWHSTVDGLIKTIEETIDLVNEDSDHTEYSLIIHAPVDGVIINIPDHGLNAERLAEFGFAKVFAGHYHNHTDFDNGVYSIGALTHQTWGDVGTRAGFLIAKDDGDVEHHPSIAPKFIDFDPDEHDIEVVEGNYVRVSVEVEKESQIKQLRKEFEKAGAEGVVINAIKKTATVSRTGATVSTGKSIAASITDFTAAKKYKHKKKLDALCLDIMSDAESSK